MRTDRETPEARALAALKSRITRYFNDCRGEDTPATPAGLALALGMRTEALTAIPPTDARAPAIGRALQRIEAEAMERALNGKNGAKGLEMVLQQTARAQNDADELSALTDQELDDRLSEVARAIEGMIACGPAQEAPGAPEETR